MQHPHEDKRRLICDAAARLFATRPFHEVRLDDVAAAAGIGKGTLYIYFNSKEDLYSTLIYEGFAALVDSVGRHLEDARADTRKTLRLIIGDLVAFAVQHPAVSEIMRSISQPKRHRQWAAKHRQLCQLIESVIRRGIRRREFRDTHPEITALFIPGMVRSLFLFEPQKSRPEVIVNQIVTLLEHGLCKAPRS